MKRGRANRVSTREQREKRFVRLGKEQRRLWSETYKRTLVPLDQPIRHGWYRTFVWKNPETVIYRPDYKILQALLDEYNPIQWSVDKKFRYLGRDTAVNKKEWLKKNKLPQLGFEEIHPATYGKLPEEQKKYFRPVWHLDRWTMKDYMKYQLMFPVYLLRIKKYPRFLNSSEEKDWQAVADCDRLEKEVRRRCLDVKIASARDFRMNGRDEWSVNLQRSHLREKDLDRDVKEELQD